MPDHVIHKQKLVLKVSKDTDAFALQNRISALLRDRLPAQLEQVFDRYIPKEKTIRLESLSLDLGLIEGENIEALFEQRLLEKIGQEIYKRTEHPPAEANLSTLSPSRALQDALFYFLRKGRLPWYKTVRNRNDWEEEMRQVFTDRDWSFLRQWFAQNSDPSFVQRLVFQFSDGFLLQLLAAVPSPENGFWEPLYHDIYSLVHFFSGRGTARAREQTWTCIIHQVLQQKDRRSWHEAVARLLTNLAEKRKASNKMRLTDATGSRLQTAFAKNVLVSVKQQIRQKNSRTGGLSPIDLSSEAKPGVAKKEKQRPSPEPGEELFVENCGVVLLHPFLEMFFTGLQMMEGRSFANTEAHQKAVLLLHYLATGETGAAEFSLTLQKLLCGFPLDDSLPVVLEMNGAEREEAAQLLQSVIGYWPPLKNTSISGLQETFLRRPGKLTHNESGWHLLVEQKTVDVLLGKLPWGFSTIRLPWMEALLSVEWG